MSISDKKILFLSHSQELNGGAEKSLFELVKDTKKHGYDPVLILPGKGLFEKNASELGITTYVVSFPWWARVSGQTIGEQSASESFFVEILEILQKESPLLCVTNTIVVPWLAYAAAITRIKHVWIAREFGNGDHGLSFNVSSDSLYRAMGLLSEKVFCNSKATKDFFATVVPTDSSIDVIYPFVPKPKVSATNSSSQSGKFRICLVGQIKKSKGQLEAVRAFNILNKKGLDLDLELVLVGGVGEYQYVEKIKKYISQNKLEDQVIFTGFLNNPADIVSQSNLLLVCSNNEAFGRVTIEAMYAKKPIVAAASGGTLEIVENNKNGILYKPGDSHHLAAQIQRIINDPKWGEALGKMASDSALSRFSLQQAHGAFFSYLSHIQETPPSSLDLSPLENTLSQKTHIDTTKEPAMGLNGPNGQLEETQSLKGWNFMLKIRKLSKLLRFK